jgi:DNA primase
MSSYENNRKPLKEKLSVKKIPTGKDIQRGSRISINLRSNKKHYSTLVELAKRKIPNAVKLAMPTAIKPMNAVCCEEPFNDKNWQFELNLAGIRAIAYLENSVANQKAVVNLKSSDNENLDGEYPWIIEALEQWQVNAVVDGEIVRITEDGLPAIEDAEGEERSYIFYASDLLWLDGLSLMDQPLEIRREVLMEIMPESGVIKFSDHIDEVGKEFYETVKLNNLNGLVAKKKGSTYSAGSNSDNWLKIVYEKRPEGNRTNQFKANTGDYQEDNPYAEQELEQEAFHLNGSEFKLHNLNRIYWREEGVTKGDVLNYYIEVASYLLPYLKDRPQLLEYTKSGKSAGLPRLDKSVKTFQRVQEEGDKVEEYFFVNDIETLVHIVNAGIFELKPWHSRIPSPHYPDWSVIEVISGSCSIEKAAEASLTVHGILKGFDIPSYAKVNGWGNIGIYIPLGGKYNYEQSRQLAEMVVSLVIEEKPEYKLYGEGKTKDSIFLDYKNNQPLKREIAPYSVIAGSEGLVSAPLSWEEIREGIVINNLKPDRVIEKLKDNGDLFDGALGKGIDLNNVLKGLAQLV